MAASPEYLLRAGGIVCGPNAEDAGGPCSLIVRSPPSSSPVNLYLSQLTDPLATGLQV